MTSSQQAPATGGSGQQNVPYVVRLDPPNAPYSNALDYLRAVDHRDLPQTIRDCLNNNTELDHYIAGALRTARVQRPLEFKPGVNPGNYQQFSTLRPWYNLHAAFVYITGNLNTPPCQSKGMRGRIRTGTCANMFPRCVIPRDDLVYVSGARFNTTACANHQYQCEGSRCVLGGIAQTQIAQTQPTSAAPQPAPGQLHSVAPITSTGHPQSYQAHDRASLAHPATSDDGSAQALQGFDAPAAHAALILGASSHAPPIQVEPGQVYPEGAFTQGYAAQEYAGEGWGQGHDDPGLASQHYNVPNFDDEDRDVQALAPLVHFYQNSQTAASQTSTTHGHGFPTYAAQVYSVQDHSASHQPGDAYHNAHQHGLARLEPVGREQIDDTVLDGPYDASHSADDQLFSSQEDYHENVGDQVGGR